jgi:hypothetical protein
MKPVKRWRVSFIVEDPDLDHNEYEIEQMVIRRDRSDVIINNIDIEELPDA